jgi:hypothetical protein
MSNTILLPFQPDSMTPAQLAAVSYLARYSGHTHGLYAYQLRRWLAGARPIAWTLSKGFSGPTSSCTSATSVRAG